MTNQEKSYRFFILKIFAAAVLVCTLALAAVLIVASLTPGWASSQQSGIVTEIVENIAAPTQPQEVKVARISAGVSETAATIGHKSQINVVFYPNVAQLPELVYTSSNEEAVAVSAEGELTYKSAGRVTITVSVKDEPQILSTFVVACVGLHPKDITSLTLQKNQFTVGDKFLSFDALDQNGDPVTLDGYTFSCEGEGAIVRSRGYFHATKAGDCTLTVLYKDTGYTQSFPVHVEQNADYVIPERFELTTSEISIPCGTTFQVDDYIIQPQNYPVSHIAVACSDKAMRQNRPNDFSFTATQLGEFSILIRPVAAPELTQTLLVTVVEPIPTNIVIIGSERLLMSDSATYQAYSQDGSLLTDVTWQIASGSASIDQNGKMTTYWYGLVEVQAVSNKTEEVVGKLYVRSVMFTSADHAVRKFFGHYLSFAFLGMGMLYSWLLFGNKLIKKLAAVFALLGGIAMALFTELLQGPLFTEGRAPALQDAILDSIGCLSGMIFAALFLLIVFVVVKYTKQQEEWKTHLSHLTLLSLFQPSPYKNQPTKE